MPKQASPALRIGVDGTPFFRAIDGIGRYSHDLVSTFAQQHPELKIVLVGFIGDRPNADLIDDLPANVSVYRLPLVRKLYQGLFSRVVPINIWPLAPRFDYFLHLNFTLFPYIYRGSLRNIVLVHDTTFIDVPEVVAKRNLPYLLRRVPWSIEKAAYTITNSEFTKRRVAKNFTLRPEQLYCIGTGIQDRYFKRTDKKVAGLPKQYLLCLSTLEPRKNLETLVHAHAALPSALRESYPLVLGGSLRFDNDSLRALIEQSEHVHHIGYVPEAELPSLYQNAALFVLPSQYEGFGIPLVEAMASRIPVIASDIGLFRSIGKDTLMYVDTMNINTLAQAIEYQLSQPPNKAMLEAAYTRARQFTWKKVVDKVWRLIGDDHEKNTD